jgi:SAM-dependent methyltransferase
VKAEDESGEALNRRSYDRIVDAWDRARRRPSERELPWLEALAHGLPNGASVLDLGCGTGRPLAAWLLHRGYAVTGVDQSAALLARARQRFPDAHWIEAEFGAWLATEPAAPRFTAALCWDALFHVERTRHGSILADLRRLLPVGGRLLLTSGGSPGPAFTDTMFGERFFYDAHDPAGTVALLRSTGFRIRRQGWLDVPTTGRDKGRFAVLAERVDSPTGARPGEDPP